jgi:hypothetical protein
MRKLSHIQLSNKIKKATIPMEPTNLTRLSADFIAPPQILTPLFRKHQKILLEALLAHKINKTIFFPKPPKTVNRIGIYEIIGGIRFFMQNTIIFNKIKKSYTLYKRI